MSIGVIAPGLLFGGRHRTSVALAVTAATSLSVTLRSTNSTPLTIDWGDGSRSVVASNAAASHTYAAAFTGSIRVKTVGAAKITYFNSASSGWAFDLNKIPNATYIVITGSNTVTGNLSSIPNATYIVITGSNTVTGNLSSIPLATAVNITGSNTVTGNLSSIPLATYVVISGSHTTTFSGAWTQTTMREVYVRPTVAWLSTPTDDLLNALAATVTTWITEKVVNINGSCTAASEAAIVTLLSQGVTVTIGSDTRPVSNILLEDGTMILLESGTFGILME